MSTWLFDLGNTRLKFAELRDHAAPGETHALAHDDGERWLDGLPRGATACIASVMRRMASFAIAVLSKSCIGSGRCKPSGTIARSMSSKSPCKRSFACSAA